VIYSYSYYSLFLQKCYLKKEICVASLLVLMRVGTGRLQKLGLLVLSLLTACFCVDFYVVERGLM
jgi:hypothetical protein